MSAKRGHGMFKKLLAMEGEEVFYLPFDLASSEEFEGWEEGKDAFKDGIPLSALVSYELTERVLSIIGEDVRYSCVAELSIEQLAEKDITVNEKDAFEVDGKPYRVTRFRPTRHYGGSPAAMLVALEEGMP
jgi:hypothetical protein